MHPYNQSKDMGKKVLILSGSPRRGGNSDTLCDQFLKGAQEAGNDVEKYFIPAHNIGYCSACYYCRSHNGECCKKDDMAALMPKILEADVLVFSSPVYMYSVSAQLKAVFDRMVAQYEVIRDKEVYYIMTAAEDAPDTMATTIGCMRGMADCIPGSKELGMVCATGVYEKGAVVDTPYMQEAYELGKSVG